MAANIVAGAEPAEQIPDWRVACFDHLQELRAVLAAARSIDITVGNNAYASDLVRLAVDRLDQHKQALWTLSGDDYYGDCFCAVHALLMGARDMSKVSAPLKAVLAVACDMAQQIARVLDEADLPRLRTAVETTE